MNRERERYCEWCGKLFTVKWHRQECCSNSCAIDHADFQLFCDEEERAQERIDGDISGFFEEDSEDVQLIRELVGDGFDYEEDEVGGEG